VPEDGTAEARRLLKDLLVTPKSRLEEIDTKGILRVAVDAACDKGDARELWVLCSQAEKAYKMILEKFQTKYERWWLPLGMGGKITLDLSNGELGVMMRSLRAHRRSSRTSKQLRRLRRQPRHKLRWFCGRNS